MRLDQPIDVMGKFWLPEQSEEDGVIGRLIIQDGYDITLTLYGTFTPSSPNNLPNSRPYAFNNKLVFLKKLGYISSKENLTLYK